MTKIEMRNTAWIILLAVVWCCNTGIVGAQDENKPTGQVEGIDKEDVVELENQFYEIQEEFREYVLEAQRIGIRYLNSPTLSEADRYIDDYKSNFDQGNAILEKWIPVGEKLFEAKTAGGVTPDADVLTFMSKVMERRFTEYNYETSYEISKQLMEINQDDPRAGFFFAKSALMTNRFGPEVSSAFEKFKMHFQKEKALSDTENVMISNIYYLNEAFDKEKFYREKEAKADDLPRVLFKTTKGDFVIELFENEAPESVANFISLVESKHFDDLVFDTVIDKTAAQTGRFTESFTPREIDYTIQDEHEKPNARMSFAGSVVMFSPQPNSADSLFFISLSSLVNLHKKQTVFGRVYSGMDVVYSLNQTFKVEENKQIPIEGVEPDKVIAATVVRKRDHEYIFKKIKKK